MSGIPRREMARLLLIGVIAWCGAACGVDGLLPKRRPPLTSEPTLDAATIPKYVEPLVIPPTMPISAVIPQGNRRYTAYYEIGVREFQQQVLPRSYPKTTVWGYGSIHHPQTFHYPAYTIEARVNHPVRVKWFNQLVDKRGDYLPPLLPVDQTLHWANPPGPRDSHGTDPTLYEGPMPIVTHVHGAHVPAVSDGNPEAWYLPAARDIPAGTYRRGTTYGSVAPTKAGAAVFEYPNDQRPTTLWYHDHALGVTRLNVYSGMAGFWLLRGDEEDRLNLPRNAPKACDKPGKGMYEVPLAIQDRSFNADGSLFYPMSRAFFDQFTGPFRPESDVPPIWNPEFFGQAMVVNGRTWPYFEVEPRKYRFRVLNGCNSRFLILKLSEALPFLQIGNEGGFLPAPVTREQLLLGPAERADVIVDFSTLPVGTELRLLNLGPDSAFSGLPVETPANPATTGQVMQFRVVPLSAPDESEAPQRLPPISALDFAVRTRDLTLNEQLSSIADIPAAVLLGTAATGPLTWNGEDLAGEQVGREFNGLGITENPGLYETEIWRLINLTADAHPIHLHLVMFEVLDRTPFNQQAYLAAQELYLAGGKVGAPPDPLAFVTGPPQPAEPWEAGRKDTVIAYPGMFTRIKATFDLPGLYVWHCHILEHEDNEMMRPYYVGEIP